MYSVAILVIHGVCVLHSVIVADAYWFRVILHRTIIAINDNPFWFYLLISFESINKVEFDENVELIKMNQLKRMRIAN